MSHHVTAVLPCGKQVFATDVGDGRYHATIPAVCDCAKCQDAATKSAQVAAIRVRLGDIYRGVSSVVVHVTADQEKESLRRAVNQTFRAHDGNWIFSQYDVDIHRINMEVYSPSATDPTELTSLALWLWERGVRG